MVSIIYGNFMFLFHFIKKLKNQLLRNYHNLCANLASDSDSEKKK
jgi:hypothetical protein